MRNKFPGVCYYCGKHCDVGAGHFERNFGSWLIIHAECVFIHRNYKTHGLYKQQVEKMRCLTSSESTQQVNDQE